MPTLLETIGDYEEDLLLMIANQWGIELSHVPFKNMAKYLAESAFEDARMKEFLESLPEREIEALKEIAALKGRLAWSQCERKFGLLREMGAARRQREHPDTQPISITESLYYKGLIGKAFFDAPGGPKEFAFIPDEILPFFAVSKKPSIIDSLSVIPEEKVLKKWLANDFIVDHATTALAAIRCGIPLDQLHFSRPEVSLAVMTALLCEGRLITPDGKIDIKEVKSFLEARRGEALTSLFKAWKSSTRINEVLLIPTVKFDKEPKNNPVLSRAILLEVLSALPDARWFSIEGLINTLHLFQPDILRTGGEYDAWFIKDSETGQPLIGFQHWREIEGRYVQTMIQGPFTWFGLVDLGKSAEAKTSMCFRRSRWADTLLEGQAPEYPTAESRNFILDKNGHIIIDRYFPRDIRYQVARFCDWDAQKGNRYEYRITPASLSRVAKQGLTVNRFLPLLQKYARKPIPVNVIHALKRWEKNELEAEIAYEVLIKVKSAKILDALLNSAAKPYILERLNPQIAIVKNEGIPFFKAALLEMGYFLGDKGEVEISKL